MRITPLEFRRPSAIISAEDFLPAKISPAWTWKKLRVGDNGQRMLYAPNHLRSKNCRRNSFRPIPPWPTGEIYIDTV